MSVWPARSNVRTTMSAPRREDGMRWRSFTRSSSSGGVGTLVAGTPPATTRPIASDRIPRINVAGPFQRGEAVLHRRQPMFGKLLRRPAVRTRHDADRARLVVQIDLVATHTEDLPGHAARGIGAQERDQLRDVIR